MKNELGMMVSLENLLRWVCFFISTSTSYVLREIRLVLGEGEGEELMS